MADNMIELVAKLNLEDSAIQINKDIESLQQRIQSLKIKCDIDTTGISNLKTEIGNIAKNATIKPLSITDDGSTKKVTDKVLADFNKAFGLIGKMGDEKKEEFDKVTKEMLQSLKDAWQKAMATGVDSEYNKIFDSIAERIDKFSRGDVQKLKDSIADIRKQFTDGSKVKVEGTAAEWLKTQYDQDYKKYLDAIYGRDNYNIKKMGATPSDTLYTDDDKDYVERLVSAAQKIIELQDKINSNGWGLDELWEQAKDSSQVFDEIRSKIHDILGLPQLPKVGDTFDINTGEIDTATNKVEELHKAITTTSNLPLGDGVEHLVDNVEDEVTHLKQALAQEFGVDINRIITNTIKDAKGQINSFSFDITKLNGEIEKFSYKVKRDTDKDSGITTTTVRQTNSRESDRGALDLLKRQEAQVNSLTLKLEKLKAGFENVNAPRPIRSEESMERLGKQFDETEGSIKRIRNASSETFDSMVSDANKAVVAYETLGKALRDAENTATDLGSKDIASGKSKLGGQIDRLVSNVIKSPISDTDTGNLIRQANQIKQSLDSIGDSQGLKIAQNDFTKLQGAFDSLNSKAKTGVFLEKIEDRAVSLDNKIRQLRADIEKFANENPRAVKSDTLASNGKTFAESYAGLKNMAQEANLTEAQVKHLKEELRILGTEAKNAGEAGKSAFSKFLESFKTMSSYITANMVFNFVKRQIREMVNEVITIDTAMTELRKVTEATNEEFAKFAQSAGQTGRQLGASISDVIDATTTFARLGETLPDAEELGRVAILYKNVGDGITAETASEDLVSTMKAFKIEAQDAISVVDKFNEVGNSFAISSAGIGEALKRSASALAAANNDLSQSIALITTANTVAQDAVSVGQGIKTVSLRLRSTKTDLEAMGEDAEGAAENVSKLREQMLALTGVDIQLDDSTYKSTYQILLEISKVWDRLDDLTRSSVLEQLFGKRQANIGAAILENGELLESVYKTAINSAGSAMREQEEYAKSIQYSIDVFKAAFQDLAQTTVNNDFIKGLVDTATSFLEVLTKIIDKIGTLPAILGAITTVNAIRGKGKLKEYAYLHAVAICV